MTKKHLAEIALRVENLEAMTLFYTDVVGLNLLRRFQNSTFFDFGDNLSSHTPIVALFDRQSSPKYTPINTSSTTVDHIAFSLSKDDWLLEEARLLALDVPLDYATHGWVHWRSLYFTDPEGNRLEFVCYDESVTED